jgi:putative endonuclease
MTKKISRSNLFARRYKKHFGSLTSTPYRRFHGMRWTRQRPLHIRDLYRSPTCATLDPTLDRAEKSFYVYMTESKPRGVIYTGMASALAWRAQQHRDRLLSGFAKTYWAARLVYFEPHETAARAQRRDWKIELMFCAHSSPTAKGPE